MERRRVASGKMPINFASVRGLFSMEKLLPKAPINFASEWKVFYLCDSYANRFKLQKDYFASD